MKILIAGASRGIGKYLAENLSSESYQIFGTFHSTQPGTNLGFSVAKVDVTDENQVKSWIESVVSPEESKYTLINCAGLNYNAMLHKSETNVWMSVIETNLKAAYLLMKHILPIMREKHFGRVINLSSVVPQVGVAGTSAYSSSKSALWGLARTAATENAKYGITVNTINLGYFDIGMIQEVPRENLDEIINMIPVGKLGDPQNIINAVNFLMESDYITGSQININGGLY